MNPQIAAVTPHGLLYKTHMGSWLPPCSNAPTCVFPMGCPSSTKPCWLAGWLPAWDIPLCHGVRLHSLPSIPCHGTGSPYSDTLGNIISSLLSPLTKYRQSFVFSPGCIKSLFSYSHHYFSFILFIFRSTLTKSARPPQFNANIHFYSLENISGAERAFPC